MLYYTKEEQNVPQFLMFKENSTVEFKIIPNVTRIDGVISCPMEILSEENKGKIHLFRVNEKFPNQVFPFLHSFFTAEQLSTEPGVSETELIGKHGKCVAGKINDKGFQNLNKFEEVKELVQADIPF